MLTRLGRYADRTIELGWLFAVVFTPLYFNVYSSRVFEPDKISTLRSLVLIMTLAWIIKLLEGGVSAYAQSSATTVSGKLLDTAQGAAERGLPGWLGFLRVPMVIPILVYALAYFISTLFTLSFDATIWGSYQRLQGTYSQYSYMMLGILVLANLRTRPQADRLVNFMILTSLPVALYGIVQAAPLLNSNWVLDPLPWAGDTSTRVASTMGNAIFVAAWLIMVVPLTLYKLFNGVSASIAARRAEELAEEQPERPRQASSRKLTTDRPNYGWAVVGNIFGVLMIQAFVFLLALRLMKGLPFPDASWSWVLPAAIIIFFIGCHLIEWLRSREDESRQVTLFMPIVGVTLFVVATLAFCFTWSVAQRQSTPGQPALDASGQSMFDIISGFDRGALLWVIFFTLLWGAATAGAFTLSSGERTPGRTSPIVRATFNFGYGVLVFMQVLCIYLTQSRGPWLGLGVGLAVFALAMWLVGRSKGVRWMARFGGTVSAMVLAGVVFIAVLNIPGSPLKALNDLPVFGRGVERLSTLFRTEDGTGKVRELIWKGAADLIIAEPARALIGWGPESMYVAYNPYYPAELARWELRNATPDRSHNAEFDQMVTLGVLGLFAYYFLVAAFFFYGIRVLRRVRSTKDQLLLIALLSVMAAHFIEIQTGIQIAATWTYFYSVIGLLVAFGYYVTPHLREKEEPVAETVPALERVRGNGAVQNEAEALTPATPLAAPRATTVATQQKQKTATMSVTNGKAKPEANGRGDNRGIRRDGAQRAPGEERPTARSSEARRRHAPSYQLRGTKGEAQERWYSNPLRLGVYIALALGVWTFNFGLTLPGINIPGVNSATVRADSYYKNGLTYDGQKAWPESISYYRQAIALQPNQDYYYLFLGRSWLEFAKQTDNEQENYRIRFSNQTRLDVPCNVASQAYADTKARAAEKECRLRQSEYVLNLAHNMNPLNSDHYANLGRLYLYWADATGLGDATKSKLAVENLKAASERTPGNAQLRDELAVAYSRDNQFAKAIETLQGSQALDPFFARTPSLLGQLYQERASTVRGLLVQNDPARPLPTDGETDYGKLLVGSAQAYSTTIGLDMTQFVDTSYRNRIEYLLEATKPFTATNTTLEQAVVSDIVTTTLKVALERKLTEGEKAVADLLRARGAYQGEGNVVPGDILQGLWNNPDWATVTLEGDKIKSVEWLDTTFPDTAKTAVLSHYALGYIYQKTGQVDRARESYDRMLALDPNSQEARDALQQISGETP